MLCPVTEAQQKEEAVYLNMATDLEISLIDNAIQLREHFLSEKAFYSDFDKHSRASVTYSDLSPISELKAETLTPFHNRYKKSKVSTIETKDIVQPGIFYGGYKRKEFVFPNISDGSIGRLEYTREIKDLHLISPFYFDESIHVKAAEYSVSFLKNIKLKYKLFGNLKDKIKFNEVSDNKTTRYSWTLTDIPSYQREIDAPSFSYYGTHIIVYIDSYQAKGESIKVSGDVADLYRWYNSVIGKIPSHGDYSVLNQFLDKRLLSTQSNEEKAKIIFQWVQKNIK